MHLTKRTYYKALFLLIVFSMNTAVSFACSVSDLFHGMHHHKQDAAQHEHVSGEKHKHQHNSSHHDTPKDENRKQDCCSSAVTTLQKTDKSVNRTLEVPKAHVFTSFLLAYTAVAYALYKPEQTVALDHLRWRLPATIPDLRIVIQSFQI